MVKAALFSLALHGALFWTLRSARVLPRPPSPSVEFEVTRVRAPTPSAVSDGSASGGGRALATRSGPARRTVHSQAAAQISVAPETVPAEAPKPNLFVPSALGHAAGLDVDAP